MKRLLAILAVGVSVCLGVTGCEVNLDTDKDGINAETDAEETETEAEEEAEEEEEVEEEDEENYETGDASLDDPRNQDEIGDKELLVVSFGTSYNDSRRLTIGAIEGTLEEAFPDYSVRRGFTSNIIIDHVNNRDGILIDDVKAALDRAVDNGVKELVIQPTHLMDGYEYNDLIKEAGEYADKFDSVIFGKPLLTTDEDFKAVEEAITDWTEEYDDGETAIIFMGHGTEADSNGVYQKLQDLFIEDGFENYYVGTVEATPSLDDVIQAAKDGDYKKVVLEPLMVVAGDHANNDMAGDEDGAWKKEFEKAGFEVTTLIRGLGENEDIRKLYVKHAKEVIESGESLEGAGGKQSDGVIKVSDLNDGTYEIDVDSSSEMFNIEECELTVKDGEATAKMIMSGTGYLYVYMGTETDADRAEKKDYIYFEKEEDGRHSFTVPVEALNEEVDCAAFSKKREKWYGRTLKFRSDKLPEDAYREGTSTKAAGSELEDGEYTADVELSGGSGRASVESPAKIVVKNGEITATIVWSSPNYDYMIVDGEKYLPVNTEGNSEFEIPVAAFDTELEVTADTTAMSKPHEIEYALKIKSDTVK